MLWKRLCFHLHAVSLRRPKLNVKRNVSLGSAQKIVFRLLLLFFAFPCDSPIFSSLPVPLLSTLQQAVMRRRGEPLHKVLPGLESTNIPRFPSPLICWFSFVPHERPSIFTAPLIKPPVLFGLMAWWQRDTFRYWETVSSLLGSYQLHRDGCGLVKVMLRNLWTDDLIRIEL